MPQLRPQVDRIGGQLLHLRTSAGAQEVDAVIEVGRDVIGIEVTHGVRPAPGNARHLGWVRERLGARFAAGYVVHTGGDTYPLGERLWAVPFTALAGV